MAKLIGFDKKEQAKKWIRKMNKANKEISKTFALPKKNVVKFEIKKVIDKKRKKPVYIVEN